MQYRGLIVLIFFLAGTRMRAGAATVDTILTHSTVMNKDIKTVVIQPAGANTVVGAGGKRYPVVYLLHGASGDYSDWIRKVPAIRQYADQYGIMIVCPDGNGYSWYFDSPVDSSYRYETYISRELVSFVDAHYPTIADRRARAIMGLSMGGHGALFLSFRHQDVFGAAGSMSGGVDLRPFPDKWGIAKRLGALKDFPGRWEGYSVTSQTGLLRPGALTLIFDCGTDDFFYGVNVALHEKLAAARIPHDFIVRPGGHTWEYWANAVQFQLLFMHHYFEEGIVNGGKGIK